MVSIGYRHQFLRKPHLLLPECGEGHLELAAVSAGGPLLGSVVGGIASWKIFNSYNNSSEATGSSVCLLVSQFSMVEGTEFSLSMLSIMLSSRQPRSHTLTREA